MSWSVNPVMAQRQTGPSWVESIVTQPRRRYGSWFALLEKVVQLQGDGSLNAVLVPHLSKQAGFAGGGALAAVAAPRKTCLVPLSGDGSLIIPGFETHSCTANFIGGGEYATFLNDGLTAIVQHGYPVSLSGSGAFAATTAGGFLAPDGLSAGVQPLYSNTGSGTGTLAFALSQKYAIGTNLSGDGSLTAMAAKVTQSSPAFSGGGSLSATVSGSVNAVTIVGVAVAAEATSITLPAHNVGDLIIMAAARLSSAITKPTAGGTVPNFIDIDNGAGGGTVNGRTAWAIATANNHTSGVWSSATALCAVVLRGHNPSSPIGGHAIAGGISGALTAPAVTMTKTDGTSELFYIYGRGSANLVWDPPPAGCTTQVSSTSSTNVAHICMNTKNVTTSDGSSALVTTGAFIALTVEVHI